MMGCRPSDSMMMCRHQVDTLPRVPSLVDEVVELNAHNRTSQVQEDKQQLPWAAVDRWS